MRLIALLLALVTTACATSRTPQQFEVRSRFDVNLLQRLIGDASEKDRPLDALSAADRAVWQEAVAAVRKADRVALVELRIALVATPKKLEPQWRALLDRVAPIYRKTWWTDDDAKNREWIAMIEPLLAEHGPALLAEHARSYGVTAPARARIDVVEYAGPFGGQTMIDDAGLPYVNIAPHSAVYRGNAALELVMHEVSHSLAFPNRGTIGGIIAEHSKTLGISPPYNLWHAILFFNTGELTRRYFAARGVEYEPYAFRTGVYTRMDSRFLPALQTWWPQVLDGKISREEGVRQIVAEVSKR